jgi:glycolate oxidase
MEKAISQEQQFFRQKIAGIVGPENVITDNRETAAYEVDGLTPKAIIFAVSTEQVAQIIKQANESRTSIIPWGSGSRQQVGSCLSAADAVLCLKKMNRITELEAGNFTVQVEAGMVNSQLQKQLAEHRFFFPLDPPYPETSTIGGDIATGATGPWRFMYGSVRDLVLGVTVVTPAGDIIHSGGKTMKNVAGLDLCKMYIGSWGTLGIITQAVLRLFPLPEVTKSFCLTFASYEDAFRIIAQILHSVLTPSAIELIDWVAGGNLGEACPSRLDKGEILLIVNIEGDDKAVARHEKEIATLAEANKAKNIATLEGEKSNRVWQAYREIHKLLLSAAPEKVQGKASVPISKLGNMFSAVKEIGRRYFTEIAIRVHGGNGILYLYFATSNQNVPLISELRRAAISLGGYFMVEAAPLWVRKKVDILPRRNDYTLMKRLKTEFDPNNILNPGRVVGGLY